jgi:hypothetical protein
MIGLEELIQLTKAKRARPRLSECTIQVTGRRMEKFVPLIWRGNRRKEQITHVVCMLGRTEEEVGWGRVWMSTGELMPQMWPHGSIAMEVRSS